MEKTIDQMTTEELEQALENKRKAEAKKLQKQKEAYEAERDDQVEYMVSVAQHIYDSMESFKEDMHQLMEEQQIKLNEYGKISKKSKGGFSITHSNGEMRVTRTRATQPYWDERSQKAVELIKDFLGDTVKKRDKELYEILISFIQKNDKGDLEYDKVMHLLSHQDKFTDERWLEGLRLIRESYSIHLKGYGYEFKVKDAQGKWQLIQLNFTSI